MAGRTPLHVACENGSITDVESELLNGVDLYSTTSYGETPIFIAAKFGHAHIVSLLKKRGADLYSQTIYGETPLLWCLRHKINIF